MRMNTESWCTVECRSSENWTRSNRKHYKKAFDSKVFKEGAADSEGRLQFPQKKEVHQERKHFPEKCKFRKHTYNRVADNTSILTRQHQRMHVHLSILSTF